MSCLSPWKLLSGFNVNTTYCYLWLQKQICEGLYGHWHGPRLIQSSPIHPLSLSNKKHWYQSVFNRGFVVISLKLKDRTYVLFLTCMHTQTRTQTQTHTHRHTHTHTWFAHVENWPFQCPMRPADAAVPGPCLPHSQWGTWCHISKQQKKLQQSHKELPEKIMPVYHRPKSTGKRNKCHQNAHSAKAKLHRKNSQRSYYVRSVNLRVRPSNQLSMTVTIHSCPWL